MTICEHFKKFSEDIKTEENELQKWNNRIKEITKKLNKKYYANNSDEDHIIIVGSVGRKTAIHNVSDYDCIFELPSEKYSQYDRHSNNGQSALLQEVKAEIQSRYVNTKVRGDGQVVVISFHDGDIELVPGFRTSDDSFKYPDSNDGGSWKITKPIPEMCESKKMANLTNNHYLNFCRFMRKWKNQVGFKFKGLLIDTLTKNFFDSNPNLYDIEFEDYYKQLIEFFKFLSNQNKDSSYWYALGSNQKIYNDDNGVFINKAKKAFNLLKDLDEDSTESLEKLKELFGKNFAKEVKITKTASLVRSAPTEEFPELKFIVDIRYNLQLDCIVEQKGFRPKKMRDFIIHNWKLKTQKSLNFFIENTDIPDDLSPYVEWYWKVRNVGPKAIAQNNERGQIIKGSPTHHESTNFTGDHYVECYAVIGDKLIARDRLRVPIDEITGID